MCSCLKVKKESKGFLKEKCTYLHLLLFSKIFLWLFYNQKWQFIIAISEKKHDCHYLQRDVKCLIIFFKVCFRTWPSSLLRILVQYTVGILNWHLGFKKCPERNPNNESEDSSLVSQVWSVSQFFLWKKTMKFLWIRPII